MRLLRGLFVTLSLASLLLPLPFASSPALASGPGNAPASCPNGCWTPIGFYAFDSGLYVTFLVKFSSSFNTTTTGTIFSVFHNSSTGPTVAQSSGNLTIAPNSNSTASLKVSGLLVGSYYSVTFYAVDANTGRNISTTADTSVSVSWSSPIKLGSLPLTVAKPPFLCNSSCADLAPSPDVMVTYKYGSGSNTTVEIYGVIRNGRGQVQNTVTESVTFSSGKSSTIPIYVGGLPPSLYELSTFAVAPNGTIMSQVDVYTFQTVPGGLLFIGEATDWTLTNPRLSDDFMSVTCRNNLNITMAAVGWVILYNSVGQTVYFSAGGIPQIAPGETGTGLIPLHGLPSGTYYATVFATSFSMVAISNSTAPFAFTY